MKKKSKANVKAFPRLAVQSFPLCIEQHPDSGWLFITCEGIPGLSVFGPDAALLFEDVVEVATLLLKKRGHKNFKLSIRSVAPTKPRESWVPANKFELRAVA